MISCHELPWKKQYSARTGSTILDFLPSLIHETVSIFRKVSAEYDDFQIRNRSIENPVTFRAVRARVGAVPGERLRQRQQLQFLFFSDVGNFIIYV